MNYDRNAAVRYALTFALVPNSAYVYYEDNDCSNFVSQCLRAGGARNDYNPSHPWWYNGRPSVCWAVAHSLYWYIRFCSVQNRFGIKANTYSLTDYDQYAEKIAANISLGNLIQYRNETGRIQHSSIVTSFDANGEPLVCQHTFNGKDVTWRKGFPEVIFHHITKIN